MATFAMSFITLPAHAISIRLRRSRTAECILAANRTDFVRELIVRVADFSCAGKRANQRFDGNSHARAGRPYVGDCSLLYEHAREPVFPRRRRFLFVQRL